MSNLIPEYLTIGPDQLGENTPVKLRICGSGEALAENMAQTMLETFKQAKQDGRNATLIIPVGPVDQFPVLAKLVNQQHFDCRDVMLINMDEYLGDDDKLIDIDHPLSFRGYMNTKFYDLLDPDLAPRAENRVFPNPADPATIQEMIDQRGGVDVCYGGIGINGHLAFNEPPEPAHSMSPEEFAALPTRVLNLSRETRTINSVTVGGEIAVVPQRAITIGMKEILAARQLRFFCNRPWQRAVVRRLLYGPLTPACPASFLRTHTDAELIVADYVAELPDIKLR